MELEKACEQVQMEREGMSKVAVRMTEITVGVREAETGTLANCITTAWEA